MADYFEHRGYLGSCEFSLEDDCLAGKILFINDLIVYDAETVKALRESFVKAVDDYLEFCSEIGKDPDKSFKGSFNVRVDPDLHREVALCGVRQGKGLNDVVKDALTQYVMHGGVVKHEHNHQLKVTIAKVSESQVDQNFETLDLREKGEKAWQQVMTSSQELH